MRYKVRWSDFKHTSTLLRPDHSVLLPESLHLQVFEKSSPRSLLQSRCVCAAFLIISFKTLPITTLVALSPFYFSSWHFSLLKFLLYFTCQGVARLCHLKASGLSVGLLFPHYSQRILFLSFIVLIPVFTFMCHFHLFRMPSSSILTPILRSSRSS